MLRTRLTYANVMATVAVFIALGGSSYAAITVTGKNVKNSSLTGKDVKNNSLTGSDVKNIKTGDVTDRSLLAKDFKGGQLPVGSQGPAGAKGSAVGFAYVDAFTGVVTVNPAFAHNLTAANITRSSAGRYCFHDLPFTPKSIMVMGEAHGYFDSVAKGTLSSTFGCDFPPNQAVVQITRPVTSSGCCYDENFFVWFE
jgi:hypothetical protein